VKQERPLFSIARCVCLANHQAVVVHAIGEAVRAAECAKVSHFRVRQWAMRGSGNPQKRMGFRIARWIGPSDYCSKAVDVCGLA